MKKILALLTLSFVAVGLTFSPVAQAAPYDPAEDIYREIDTLAGISAHRREFADMLRAYDGFNYCVTISHTPDEFIVYWWCDRDVVMKELLRYTYE
jgi:hypothetical protein